MRILLLSSEKRLKCYENQRMKEEAKALGIKFKVTLPEDFELLISNEGGEQLFHKNKPLNLPDLFIPRYTTTYFAHMITRLSQSRMPLPSLPSVFFSTMG